MAITLFIISLRNEALLRGDHNSYRAHLSKRLLTLRRRLLGRTTAKGKKYSGPYLGTAEDVSKNHEFANLWLLTAERAWAHAMQMKEARSATTDAQGITGSGRRHVISRLTRAAKTARGLVRVLEAQTGNVISEEDLLEARAYASALEGSRRLERGEWQECLETYSVARAIYAALLTATKKELFRDVLSSAVDPNVRYAAYKAQLPRSEPIPSIVRKFYPRSGSSWDSAIKRLDPGALEQDPSTGGNSTLEQVNAPQNVTWRGRTVKLEDAAIALAVASVSSASITLMDYLHSPEAARTSLKDKAAAYDEVLIASQDAVDATRHAIEELINEGVGQSDPRMQSLQITRTAAEYGLVGWRVGRNRTLIGEQDGATTHGRPSEARPNPKKEGKGKLERPLPRGKMLGRLRERVVLYDATIQSIDSVMELPGVAGDEAFVEELRAKRQYFQALKCLSIARSHSLLSEARESLALLSRAVTLSSQALFVLSSGSAPPTTLTTPTSNDQQSPLTLDIRPETAKAVHAVLQGELTRQHALVDLSNQLSADQTKSSDPIPPLIETLDRYPVNHGGTTTSANTSSPAATVDLNNLVTYPPRLEPIPVKPLFLDVAWNYIDYPGRQRHGVPGPSAAPAAAKTKEKEDQAKPKEVKRGWFGFGRS